MNNYEDTKHKIKNISNQTEINTAEIDNLKTGKVRVINLNYLEKKIEYLIFDSDIVEIVLFKVFLKNFPEIIIPFIKIIAIATNPSGVLVKGRLEEYFIPIDEKSNYLYLYWKSDEDSEIVQLKINLVISPLQEINQILLNEI